MEEQLTPMPELPSEYEVVDIQFRPGQKVYFFDPAGFTLNAGDNVIIDTARGPEFGTCTAGNHIVARKDVVAPLRPVIRPANEQDIQIAAENQAKEKKAYEVCLQKIAEQELDMQLVSAECAFDGSRMLFFFTADERVDFRELVKSLASVFHTRIELRQIGVRDKAKMVGGLGICGLPFCCASFLDDFQPVSIKMAKTQNLSLNPTKISGTCGRLMCCLKYEQDAYEDLLRTAPKAESFVDTPQGRGTVIEVDLLRQRVRVKMENQPEIINTFANSEIAVLRSGKAKKNDPPIPDDLAPISGNGKLVRQPEPEPEPEDRPVFLDSIRFRYSTETIAEETAPEEALPVEDVPQEPSEEAPEEQPRNNRRRKSRRPRQAHPEKTVQPKVENPEAAPPKKKEKGEKPAAEKAAGEKPAGENKRPHHHRYHYRRRSGKSAGEKKPEV